MDRQIIHIVVLQCRRLLLLMLLMLCWQLNAQVFNVNYANVNFGGTGVTITDKVGDGTNVGDIVLYENIITIGGQQIDAIVRTQSISNGTYSTYDYTGTSQNNEERWFSPQFSFNTGGGYADFRFEFILGGSYNNGTNTGDAVTLQNIQINSYDIDGNGNANSNQYCDFGGFSISELGNPTNLEYSYDAGTGLTRFRSTLNTNNSNAADEVNRVRCTFAYASVLDVRLGGEGSGAAYYFLDFGSQTTFSTAAQIEVPVLDLDTTTPGVDHDTTFSGDPVAFTEGITNIIYSGASIDSLKITFDPSMILDGSNERLLFRGSGSAQIALDFTNGQIISDVTIGGNTYAVKARIQGGRSKLIFWNSAGGSINLSDAEAFIDSIDYTDYSSSPTVAQRIFDVTVQDGQFESGIAQFNITFNTNLSVELLYLNVHLLNNEVVLDWATANEIDNDYFSVERVGEEGSWEILGYVSGAGTSVEGGWYSFIDRNPLTGTSYYRLKQFDFDGKYTVTDARTVVNDPDSPKLSTDSGDDQVMLFLPDDWQGELELMDIQGDLVFHFHVAVLDKRIIYIPVKSNEKRRYWLRCAGSNETKVFSFIK